MTDSNEFAERLFVGAFKLLLDLDHVDLTAWYNGPDQTEIVRSEAMHRVVQRLGKLRHFVSNAANCVWQIQYITASANYY